MPPQGPRRELSRDGAYAATAPSARRRFSFAINRDLRRAALLRWMTPLLATRSSVLIAASTVASAVAESPPWMAVSALRTEDRASVRNGLFRRRRRSDTRIRFNADLLFAKTDHPSRHAVTAGSALSRAAFAPLKGCYQIALWGSTKRVRLCPGGEAPSR